MVICCCETGIGMLLTKPRPLSVSAAFTSVMSALTSRVTVPPCLVTTPVDLSEMAAMNALCESRSVFSQAVANCDECVNLVAASLMKFWMALVMGVVSTRSCGGNGGVPRASATYFWMSTLAKIASAVALAT